MFQAFPILDRPFDPFSEDSRRGLGELHAVSAKHLILSFAIFPNLPLSPKFKASLSPGV
jgi:hypothetical protein